MPIDSNTLPDQPMIQKILTFSAAILLVISCGALVGFAHEAEETARYADLEVDVQEIDGMFFVDAAGVRDQILSHDSITGSFIADVQLQHVIEWVRSIPAVDDVRVYPGLNRVLHVQVTQRKPLARVHTGPDEADVYLDSHGRVLPLSPYYTARVPIIHADDIEMCDVAFDLIQATHEDILWSAFIDQIEVKPDGSVDIIPRLGSSRIHLGFMENLDHKLNKLHVFYREQIARGNLNAYKRIDLTYQDQVVAQRYY